MDKIGYIKIPLHGYLGEDKYTLVDGDYDGEYFSQFKWYLMKNGYVSRVQIELPSKERKNLIYLHQQAAGPKLKGKWVDHINRNKLDNRSCNLRYITPQESAANRSQSHRASKSGYRGVQQVRTVRKNISGDRVVKWHPTWSVIIAGKHRGTFKSKEEAARVYNKLAQELYGAYSIQNKL